MSAGDFGRRASGPSCRGTIARQLLGLSLVWRTRVVNATQDASVDQVTRGLINLPITFFATSHLLSLRSKLFAIGSWPFGTVRSNLPSLGRVLV